MATAPKLRVVWPNGPTVTVEVDVEPVIRSLDVDTREREGEEAPVRTNISRVDLASLDAMHAFLRRATYGHKDGDSVTVLILEPRLPDLLQVLGVPPTAPAEFEVRLPNV